MKNKDLYTIRSTGFKTPDNYFQSLDNSFYSKLAEEKIAKKINSNGYKIPEGYFETFDSKVLDVINAKKDAKVIPLFSWKKVVYISGIAASIVILFNLSVFEKPISFETLDINMVENYIIEEAESSELTTLFLETELHESDFIDYNVSDETINSYIDTFDEDELILE